mmetsp:Transcript_5914/g.16563  ORF Transcript_5914/g.16563 Transcript_5914/m.16563 type:complete len:200 (+) Transcript_5914:498-1097(+)
MLFLRPKSPLVGRLYLILVNPSLPPDMSSICAFLAPIRPVTAPTCSSGTSMTASSKGSSLVPSSLFFVMTLGGPTQNSYPSRLMVSIRIPRCSAPRPLTSKLSAPSPGATRRAKFLSNSLSSRSFRFLLVTNLPSCPANGLVFTANVIVTVGSSTAIVGNGSWFAGSHSVSPMLTSARPVRQQISPAITLSTGLRLKLS